MPVVKYPASVRLCLSTVYVDKKPLQTLDNEPLTRPALRGEAVSRYLPKVYINFKGAEAPIKNFILDITSAESGYFPQYYYSEYATGDSPC